MRTKRKGKGALAAALLLTAGMGLVASQHASANLAGSQFEGHDANTANAAIPPNGGVDWANLATQPGATLSVGTDSATGQCDDSFTQGSKEDDTNVVIGQGSIPNSKADLNQFAVGSYIPASGARAGNLIMTLAWVRNNTSGSTNFDFEINQAAQPITKFPPPCPPLAADKPVQLDRRGDAAASNTPGGNNPDDLLISYDLAGGAQKPTISYRRWTGTAWSAEITVNDVNSEGSTNTNVAIPPGQLGPFSAVAGSTGIPAAQFGEADLDLTALGIVANQNDPNAPCTAFGSAYVKSRASNSFPAQMKDYIAPIGVGINTCGSITIDKVTLPGNDPQSFNFDGTPAAPLKQLADFSLTDQATPKQFTGLTPGSYAVSESVPTGWDLTSAVCSDGSPITNIQLGPKENITCTFTNTKRGVLIVDKVTAPDPDLTNSVFNFTSDVAGTGTDNQSNASFTLTNAQPPHNSGAILPGTYNVSETAPAGWTPGNHTCSDGSPVSAVVVDPGETVTCTFRNTGLATVVIQKATVPAGATDSFAFTSNFGNPTDFNLTDGTNRTTPGLSPGGSYNVAETPQDSWDLTSFICDDAANTPSTPAAINLSPSETVTCTATNTKRARIIVDKVTDPAGSPQSFHFNTTGEGYTAGFDLTDAAPPNDTGYSLKPNTAASPHEYSVAEVTPPGWEQKPSAAVCSGGADPAHLQPAPGETITCVFTNEQDAHIFVSKVTDPAGDPAEFTFSSNYGADFKLHDGDAPADSGALDPGTYNVAETPQAGWTLTDSSCTSTDGGPAFSPASISLQAGEIVNCTFHNRKDAGIIIEKEVSGPNNNASFTFASGPAPFAVPSLKDGESFASSSVGNLVPDTYNATENGQTNWKLLNDAADNVNGNVVCSDGSKSDAISLQAGETVTCHFVNEWQVGAVRIHKVAKSAAAGGNVGVPGVVFTITDANDVSFDMPPTDADGYTCVDSFGFQTLKRIHESQFPAGYSPGADLENIKIDTVAYCPSNPDPKLPHGGSPLEFQVENTPLTDVTITVDSLIGGGTNSRIDCYDKDGNLIATRTAEDGSLYIPNIKPTDPLIATLDCKVFIDP